MLRGFHCSESIVLFHLVYWMSSFSVVVLIFVWFWGLLLVFAIRRHPAFCISPVLYNLRIVDRPQDVLMTVRASSAHGMSYKKSLCFKFEKVRMKCSNVIFSTSARIY